LSELWGDFPAPAAAQKQDLRVFLRELDAGRADSEPVRKWIDAGAPFAYLLRALSLVKSGHRDEAAYDVTQAIERAPHSVFVRTVAARIRFVLCDYTAALADLDAASVPGPSNTSSARRAAASALDWKFELTRRLGGYIEALDAIVRALALDQDKPQRNLGRLEQAAELLHSNSNYEGALRCIDAALALDAQSIGLYMRAATIRRRLGDLEGTRRAIGAATALSPRMESGRAVTVRLDGARYLIELGAVADAEAELRSVLELEPGNAEARALCGQLASWAGDHAEAARFADEVIAANLAAGWRLRGALHVLAGEHALGIEDLDEALRRDDRDYEAHVWRGEALFRLGRLDEAFSALNRGGEMAEEYADYFAPQILRLLVQAARGDFPGLPEQGVPDALDCLFPGERERIGATNVAALCGLLERALVWMRGNRRFTATYVNPDDPAAGLTPLRVPPSPRTAAKAALWRLTTAGAEGAARALQRVHRDYPSAPEPHCYHGELYLYTGDYVAARDQFERALAIYDKTRWAFIGLGAVELLEGKPELTLPLLERSVELSRGAGPTLYVYRGEALFRLGELEAAIADLEYATKLNPTRLGAWVGLALARDQAGDDGALALGLAHVRRVAPGLVHDAAIAAPVDVSAAEDAGPPPDREVLRTLFETMLRLMRGNRSSTCVTYFTGQGSLRVVPPLPVIDTQLEEREVRLLRALLERSVGLARA
jgi:tetratricopeptide (TPR) repeat protein